METEITLQKIKLAFSCQLPEDFTQLIDGEIKVRDSINKDLVGNLLTAKLSGYLWGEPGPSQTIKYPATWWDAFKLRWFPAWLLDRYPAIYQYHQIDIMTLYPQFRISVPGGLHVLKFSVRDYKATDASEQ